MLKKRIIVLLTLYDGVLFRTKKFIPDYRYTLNFVDLDHVDEVVILDVTPGGNRKATLKVIEEFTTDCFVPVSAGGGIISVGEVRDFMAAGADKVVVSRGLFRDPALGPAIVQRYGAQALCVGITKGLKRFNPYPTGGEILCQSVERDGSLLGYDIEWTRQIAKSYTVPVIAGSGCGTWKHMLEAFEAGADACATSCIHHFPANAIKGFKKNLSEHGVPIRP